MASLLLAHLIPMAAFGGEEASPRLEIDQFALAAPAGAEATPGDLARYLSMAGDADEERARAIYQWITANIDYDVEALKGGRAGVGGRVRSPEEVLAERRGVCGEYSALFAKLCHLSGLEAEVIPGIGRGSGYTVGSDIPGSRNHAWNAVKIDGEWRLVDSTWGAGYLDPRAGFVEKFEEFYFLTPPEYLVWTHLPEDPRWQLLDLPISRGEYVALPYPKAAFFNNDILILEPMEGTIGSGGEAAVLLSAPEDVRFIAELLDERGEKLPGRFAQVQRSEDGVLIRAEAPGPGNYTLRIYSKRSKAEEAYAWTLDYRIAAGRNAPAVIGYPVVWDSFSEMGLEAKSHPGGLIEAGSLVEVAFSAPRDVRLLARLLDGAGRELPEGRGFAQREGGDYVVRATFPAPGEYTLRIYGRRGGDPGGDYAPVLEYTVVAGAGSDGAGYPRALGAFAAVGARLIHPLEGRLQAGAREFDLLVPGAEDVAVINGGVWSRLAKDGESFQGEAVLSGGEARVAARFADDPSYRVLLVYDVV
ncbi:MAG: transglutaminase domain-containing protein [Methanothrix sp.]